MHQARTLLEYAHGILESTKSLSQLVAGRKRDEIDLTNGISIVVRAASFRRVRGFTAVAVLADEAAFWQSENSANPDIEILNALRPALATTGGPLICISSPYAKRGALWNAYRKYYGPEGDSRILVVRGPSRTFNPELSQEFVEEQLARDPIANRAEYLAEFRTDVESFIDEEVVRGCISPGVRERKPEYKHSYTCFIDPSGGSGNSMTMAISHREGETVILDAIRECKPPFEPTLIVEEFASLARSYKCARGYADKYGGEWVVEAFRKAGLHVETAETPTKNEIYIDALPMLNTRQVDLLDHERMVAQLTQLERSTVRGGRDRIDHPHGLHDDVANAVCGALVMCSREPAYDAGQRLRDNMKLEAAYKKLARSFA